MGESGNDFRRIRHLQDGIIPAMITVPTHPLRARLGRHAAVRYLAHSVGVDLYSHTEDRRVLEKVILPELSLNNELARILFVGCDWYTRRYQQLFARQEFWTLDVDPEKARYGAGHHVTGCVTDVDRHFARGQFDAIVCNGVFGWGLNARNDVEKAFWGFHRVMRPDGIFVLGWNDTPERSPIRLDDCLSLRAFRRYDFPALGRSRFLTSTAYRHTYDFYLR